MVLHAGSLSKQVSILVQMPVEMVTGLNPDWFMGDDKRPNNLNEIFAVCPICKIENTFTLSNLPKIVCIHFTGKIEWDQGQPVFIFAKETMISQGQKSDIQNPVIQIQKPRSKIMRLVLWWIKVE